MERKKPQTRIKGLVRKTVETAMHAPVRRSGSMRVDPRLELTEEVQKDESHIGTGIFMGRF